MFVYIKDPQPHPYTPKRKGKQTNKQTKEQNKTNKLGSMLNMGVCYVFMAVATSQFVSYGILVNKRSRWRNFIFDMSSLVQINEYSLSILAYQKYIRKYWMPSSPLAPRFVIGIVEITEWK